MNGRAVTRSLAFEHWSIVASRLEEQEQGGVGIGASAGIAAVVGIGMTEKAGGGILEVTVGIVMGTAVDTVDTAVAAADAARGIEQGRVGPCE